MKIWIFHNRADDLKNIWSGINQSTTNVVTDVHGSTWVKSGGQFHDVDGSDLAVIHNGIIEDVDGRAFFKEKRAQVGTWIVVSGMGKYEGRVINGSSGADSQFHESTLHWKEFIESYESIKDDVRLLAITLSQGSTPWRCEYFLELTLRLLSLDIENASVVKTIVGAIENGQVTEGEYEKRVRLSPRETRSLLEVKTAVSRLLEEHRTGDLFVDPDFVDSYDKIHELLYGLAFGPQGEQEAENLA